MRARTIQFRADVLRVLHNNEMGAMDLLARMRGRYPGTPERKIYVILKALVAEGLVVKNGINGATYTKAADQASSTSTVAGKAASARTVAA